MNSINLTSLLWFLGIGLLFYWMMRKGGCGMHAGHSHGGHEHRATGQGMNGAHTRLESHAGAVRDPVCGMQVDPARAAGTRNTMGRTFYLCSSVCLEKFDRDPESYARHAEVSAPSTMDAAGHRHGHGGC